MKRTRQSPGLELPSKRRRLQQLPLKVNVIESDDSEDSKGHWKWSLSPIKTAIKKEQENSETPRRRSSRRLASSAKKSTIDVVKSETTLTIKAEPISQTRQRRSQKSKAKNLESSSQGASDSDEDEKNTEEAVTPKKLTTLLKEKKSVTRHSDNESDDEHNYEERRLKNLADNARFLAELGMPPELTFSGKKPTTKRVIREKEVLPRRQRSLRLRRIDPEGNNLPAPEPALVEPEDEHPRQPSGPLVMSEHTWGTELDDANKMITSLNQISQENNTHPTLSSKSQEEFVKKFNAMKMRDFIKATKDRIFSVAIHPTASMLLGLAGDKWGRLAIWDMMKGQDGVATFLPHSRPINHIVAPMHDHSRIYSCSYDGTLRVTNLEKGLHEEVYVTNEDDDVRLMRFDFLSPSSLVVAQNNGDVVVVDNRTDSTSAESVYPIDDRVIKCVNVHPTEKHYFLSATNTGVVKLWDLRSIGKKTPKCVTTLPHSKVVDAAHFSPVNGHRILTTSLENTINVYDSSNLSQITKLKAIRHYNWTGRWLSNFRAEWHPQREDVFVIGSMSRPRQIEVFSTSGSLVKTFMDLTSVFSLNAFHPTRDALVGGNSSGRLVSFF